MKKINTSHLVVFVFTLYVLSSFLIFSGCKPDDIDIVQPKDSVVLEVITENYAIDWVKKFGAEKGDRFGAVAQTEDGDIIVVSITDTTAVEITCSPWDKNMYGLLHLTKLDSKGNIIWKKRYDSLYRQINGYAFFSFYSKILSTEDGYLIFFGHYSNNPCPGGVQEETPVQRSFYKFNDEGKLLWHKTISTNYTNDHAINDYKVTQEGILYFSGINPNSIGYKDYIFTTGKIDFKGNIISTNSSVTLEACKTCGDAEYTKPKLTKNDEIIRTAKNGNTIYFMKYDLNGKLNFETTVAENTKEAWSCTESDASATKNGGYLVNYGFYTCDMPDSGILGTMFIDSDGLVTDKYKDGMKFKYSEIDGDVYEINSKKWGKYLVKYDVYGEKIWKKQYVTNFSPLASGETLLYKTPTPDGGYLAGGNSNKLEDGLYGQLYDYVKFYENICLAKYKKD